MLAVRLLRQHPVHQLFVRVGRSVVDERIDFFQRRRQPGQVERDPADQRITIGHFRRREALPLEPGKDEIIDFIPRPRRAVHVRQRRSHRFDVRPVLCVCRPFAHPLREELQLARRELFAALLGRHRDVGVVAGDALDQFALVGLPGDDRRVTPQVLPRAVLGVKPQTVSPPFAFLRVGPVALEAVVGEDGTDVAVEVDLFCAGKRRADCCDGDQGSDDSRRYPAAK